MIKKYFSFLFLLVVIILPTRVNAVLLPLVITGDCPSGQITVFKMSATSNAHAGLSSSSYPVSVCALGVSGLSNLCSGTFATVLKLSGADNAHGRQGDQADYPSATNACLSMPSGGSVSVGYQVGNCSGFDTTLASMSQFPTNAHLGGPDAYQNKICVSVTEPPVIQTEQQGSVILIQSSNNPPPPPAPVSTIPPSEVLLQEETFNITTPLEQIFPEQSTFVNDVPNVPNEVFNIIPPDSGTEIVPQEENSVLPNSAPISPNELATVSRAEIPQIEPKIEVPSRGLLATAFAAMSFPPQNVLDWLFWVLVFLLGFLTLRGIFRKITHKSDK